MIQSYSLLVDLPGSLLGIFIVSPLRLRLCLRLRLPLLNPLLATL
jgi:hypothetical protein